MLNNRQLEILSLLVAGNEPITGSQLSKVLNVSARTVRSDIALINDVLKNSALQVFSVNPLGYYIHEWDKERVRQLISELIEENSNNYVPQTPSERLIYQLVYFLFKNKTVIMDELAAELYVAKSTINQDLRRLTDFFEKTGSVLTLSASSKGLVLLGSEKEKRRSLVNLLTISSSGLKQIYLAIALVTKDSSIKHKAMILFQELTSILEKHGLYLADKEVSALVVYIISTCYRMRHQHSLSDESVQAVSELTLDILHVIKQTLNIQLDIQEASYLQQLVNSKRMISTSTEGQSDGKINYIVEEFLQRVKSIFLLDFTKNENLRKFLYIHIRSLLYRLQIDAIELNPLKDEIKKKFSLATEVSFVLYNLLKDEFDLIINDSEISFVALHIASALEATVVPTKVILVSDFDPSATRLLETKLISFFTNKIELVKQLTVYQYETANRNKNIACDLIVTTSVIPSYEQTPIVKVNPWLFRDDIAHLKRFINYYSTDKKDKSRLTELFDERLFFKFRNREMSYVEVIRFLVNKIYVYDYIEDEKEFFDLVMERESTYSTIMANGIAIPHAAENRARKTVVAVALFEKPIEYEGKEISVVLLNAINEKEELQNLYLSIEKVLEIDDVKPLRNVNDFQEFVMMILESKGGEQ